MSEITDALATLQNAGFELRPPATDVDIAETKAFIGATLPPEVHETYQTCDGMEIYNWETKFTAQGLNIPGEFYRLMSLSEMRETFGVTRCWGNYGAEFCCLWTNENSDYAALYIGGPLLGRITLLPHDGESADPGWRNWTNFVQRVAQFGDQGLPYDNIRPTYCDYPQTAPGASEDDADDWNAVQQLRKRQNTPDLYDRSRVAGQIPILTPFIYTDSLLADLDGNDFDLQSHVCEVLGMRQYTPAISRLSDLARRPRTGNAHNAAIGALGQMRTPESLAALLDALQAVDQSWSSLYCFRGPLEAHGAIFGGTPAVPTFHLPGETQGRPFRFGG